MDLKKQSELGAQVDKIFVTLMKGGLWVTSPLIVLLSLGFIYSSTWTTLFGIASFLLLIGIEYRAGFADGAGTMLAVLTSRTRDAMGAMNVMDEILRKKNEQ